MSIALSVSQRAAFFTASTREELEALSTLEKEGDKRRCSSCGQSGRITIFGDCIVNSVLLFFKAHIYLGAGHIHILLQRPSCIWKRCRHPNLVRLPTFNPELPLDVKRS